MDKTFTGVSLFFSGWSRHAPLFITALSQCILWLQAWWGGGDIYSKPLLASIGASVFVGCRHIYGLFDDGNKRPDNRHGIPRKINSICDGRYNDKNNKHWWCLSPTWLRWKDNWLFDTKSEAWNLPLL
jgi:hypothetical protein